MEGLTSHQSKNRTALLSLLYPWRCFLLKNQAHDQPGNTRIKAYFRQNFESKSSCYAISCAENIDSLKPRETPYLHRLSSLEIEIGIWLTLLEICKNSSFLLLISYTWYNHENVKYKVVNCDSHTKKAKQIVQSAPI